MAWHLKDMLRFEIDGIDEGRRHKDTAAPTEGVTVRGREMTLEAGIWKV